MMRLSERKQDMKRKKVTDIDAFVGVEMGIRWTLGVDHLVPQKRQSPTLCTALFGTLFALAMWPVIFMDPGRTAYDCWDEALIAAWRADRAAIPLRDEDCRGLASPTPPPPPPPPPRVTSLGTWARGLTRNVCDGRDGFRGSSNDEAMEDGEASHPPSALCAAVFQSPFQVGM